MNHNPFRKLNKREWLLWGVSMAVIAVSSAIAGTEGWLSTLASLVGVTALIFIAKGDVYGQVLTIVFSLLYGIVSLRFHYWGELITYMGMTLPAAVVTLITWLKHPYRDTDEVEVARLTPKKLVAVLLLSGAVTAGFYFILKALATPNLAVSTVSVFTSFAACMLLILRLPYYAVAYAANDVVLIVLWVLASVSDRRYLPMVLCFVMFLVNDLYGFVSWRRMRKRQRVD
ncbi:MAG: nicotinamide mononucleotide transporter [Eubacterium sp.]|nr:nicotinamide mononucleotide transporter [Eubacterium sp.]